MKGVKITYSDGRIEKYRMLYDAARAFDLTSTSFRAMAAGVGRRQMSEYGISSIDIEEHRMIDKVLPRKRRRNIHFILTKDSGEKQEVIGIAEVKRITGWGKDRIQRLDGDPDFNDGWKVESVEHVQKIDQYPFVDPVDKATIDLIRRYASHWLTRIIFVPDRENVIAFITAHVASDVSCGLYKDAKCSFCKWLYGRVRRWGGGEVARAIKVNKAERKAGGDDDDNEEWIENFGGGEDADARDRLMYDEMPEDLREVAHLVDAGFINIEIQKATGLSDDDIIDRRRRLVEWLRARIAGEGDE